MYEALKTRFSIDDLADVLEIIEVQESWKEAERLNAHDRAEQDRRDREARGQRRG